MAHFVCWLDFHKYLLVDKGLRDSRVESVPTSIPEESSQWVDVGFSRPLASSMWHGVRIYQPYSRRTLPSQQDAITK